MAYCSSVCVQFAHKMRDASGPTGSAPLLLANVTEFGVSPSIPFDRLKAMGYHVVIYPMSALRAAALASEGLLAAIRDDGHVTDATLETLQPRAALYANLGYTPGQPWLYPGRP